MEELYEIMCHNPDTGGLPLGLTGRIVKAIRRSGCSHYTIREASIPTVVGCIISDDWFESGAFELISRATVPAPAPDFKEGDRVKVVKADKDTYWYADRIGEIFTLGKKLECGNAEFFLTKEVPHCYLDADSIILVEGVEEAEPSKSVIFDPEQIREASMMVSELNAGLSLTADQVEDRIYDIIKTEVAKGLHRVGAVATIGLHIRFAGLDENVTVVEVSVDPRVGRHTQFITATLDSSNNLVAQYPNR